MSGDLRLFLSPTQSIRGDEQQTARKSHTMSVARMSKMPFEVNNNSPELFQASFKRNRNESVVSVSSASSCHSDSSEDVEGLSRKSSTAQELTQKDNAVENADFKRLRSMSDGATQRLPNQEPFEVFPSLPDSVLEKMGLLGNGPRERLNEEELEQKFVALSLAFTIDAATIKDRCERQRRYRDQTENNLDAEIEKLIQKANRMQSLCIDAETTELLSALLGQIDIVMKASAHATISSERYGAVQHENRISESVHVMINHVNLLKQQRDSARRQLQYTKRVLQNTNSPETAPAQKQIAATPNGRVITKRRASIATISRPIELSKNPDARKITRRTSDLSLRASSLARNSRPNRLELGVDLVKIKEGMVESEPVLHEPEQNSDNESNQNEDNSSPEDSMVSVDANLGPLTLRQRLVRRFKRLRKNVEERYDEWTNDGTIHEICCFCALMCFSISVIILANVLLEVEFAKRGLAPSSFFWHWGGHHGNTQAPKRIYHGAITTT
ncbi:hypothetical protein Zmor_009881 [Zophobas morio]|uniref:Lymphoid-restricted membrane protein n=1 Tax=Zophobas morio TaxID=2755281 RepID=A0AA38IHV6_9CUCU|nr:hypothetical protein Zmor_009881 [Zophobas morio]